MKITVFSVFGCPQETLEIL